MDLPKTTELFHVSAATTEPLQQYVTPGNTEMRFNGFN